MRRVLVTGSREWADWATLCRVLAEELRSGPIVVVHGDCSRGADAMAKRWCQINDIEQDPHPAQWDHLGKSAGFRRNVLMVRLGADVCHAFVEGESKGTRHTVKLAKKAGIPTIIHKAHSALNYS